MDKIYQELSQYGHTETNVSLATMTTLRIGGNAKYVVFPETEVALDAVMRLIQEYKLNYKVIGKGSDLLCSDKDFDGVIIRLDQTFIQTYFDENEILAQAGSSIIALSVEAMHASLSGLEFASGIPGTVGGAVFMNAGAYKSSISDIVSEVYVYADKELKWISKEECQFNYRSSIFQKNRNWIILAARLKLKHGDKKSISNLIQDRRERRMNSQPLDYPSCGSVFRNSSDHPAWELIEGIGYRGKEIGGAKVSEKHCNFILNYNNATAEEYMTLVKDIQEKVKIKYGIQLETEMELFNW